MIRLTATVTNSEFRVIDDDTGRILLEVAVMGAMDLERADEICHLASNLLSECLQSQIVIAPFASAGSS